MSKKIVLALILASLTVVPIGAQELVVAGAQASGGYLKVLVGVFLLAVVSVVVPFLLSLLSLACVAVVQLGRGGTDHVNPFMGEGA